MTKTVILKIIVIYILAIVKGLYAGFNFSVK